VLVPRFGVKSAVRLRRPDGCVALVQQDGVLAWTSGELSAVSSERLVVKAGGLEQSYNLFQHVLVRIDVRESLAHGLELRLELAGHLEARGGAMEVPAQARREMIDQVRQEDEKRAAARAQEASEGAADDDDDGLASLHTTNSLYHFFRQCRAPKRARPGV